MKWMSKKNESLARRAVVVRTKIRVRSDRSAPTDCTVGMGRATQAGAFATCFAITNPNGLVDFAFI